MRAVGVRSASMHDGREDLARRGARAPAPRRSVGSTRSAAGAGQHQRAPGDAQADAQRGLVRPVPADVADQRVHGAVGGLDHVVEVAAEQRPPPPGPVAGRDSDRRSSRRAARGSRPRSSRVFSSACAARTRAGSARRSSARCARSRSGSARASSVAVDLALDQVVLGAGGDRLDARGARRRGRSAPARAAVGAAARAPGAAPSSPVASGSPRSSSTQSTPAELGARASASERTRVDLDRARRSASSSCDQERVAVVVLDEQHPQRGRVDVRHPRTRIGAHQVGFFFSDGTAGEPVRRGSALLLQSGPGLPTVRRVHRGRPTMTDLGVRETYQWSAIPALSHRCRITGAARIRRRRRRSSALPPPPPPPCSSTLTWTAVPGSTCNRPEAVGRSPRRRGGTGDRLQATPLLRAGSPRPGSGRPGRVRAPSPVAARHLPLSPPRGARYPRGTPLGPTSLRGGLTSSRLHL